MAILKYALIAVFYLSFTYASRAPPAPQTDEYLESMPRPSRKLDEARGIKENKDDPSSGVGVGYGSGTGNGNGVGTGYGSGSGSGSSSGSGYGYGHGEGGSGTGVGNGYGGYGSGSEPGYGHGNWCPPLGYWGCDGCPPYHDPNCGFINIPPPICVPGTGHTLPYPNSGLAKQDNHQPSTRAGETQGHAVDKNPINETPDLGRDPQFQL